MCILNTDAARRSDRPQYRTMATRLSMTWALCYYQVARRGLGIVGRVPEPIKLHKIF